MNKAFRSVHKRSQTAVNEQAVHEHTNIVQVTPSSKVLSITLGGSKNPSYSMLRDRGNMKIAALHKIELLVQQNGDGDFEKWKLRSGAPDGVDG